MQTNCLPHIMFLSLGAAYDHVVDFIRAVGEAQVALVGVHARER